MSKDDFSFAPLCQCDSCVVNRRVSARTIEEERQQLLDHARHRDGTPVSSGPKKFDAGKPRMDLIPPVVLRLMADVLEFGTRKYGPNNWASGEGLPWSKLYAALQRHLNDWWEGHALDPETAKPALAHALCQLVFLLASEQHGLGTDDRFDWSHRKVKEVPSEGRTGGIVAITSRPGAMSYSDGGLEEQPPKTEECPYCKEPGHEPLCPTACKGTELEAVSFAFYEVTK